LTVDL